MGTNRSVSDDWKKEFISLYLSQNESDIVAALEIKRAKMPQNLYRFRPIADSQSLGYALDEICKGHLYLSRPEDFNDAFDSTTLLKNKNHLDYFKNPLHQLGNALKVHYNYSDEALDIIFKSSDWQQRYKTIVNKLSYDMAEEHGVNMNRMDVAKAIGIDIMGDLENTLVLFNKQVRMARVACFTESFLNMPMWTHYGNGHKGICLEYKTEFLDTFYLDRMFPVIYEDVPDLLAGIHNFDAWNLSAVVTLQDAIIIQKHRDWAYEKEWRQIVMPGHLYENESDIPDDYEQKGQLRIFVKPSKVLLGYNIPQDVETIIREKVDETSIAKMRLTSYGLEIMPETLK